MTASEKAVLLYDGNCGFCVAEIQPLLRIASGKILPKSFQDPGVLQNYPALSHEGCMKAIHLVFPDGRIFAGAEAVARVWMLNSFFGWLAWIYYLPGIRQMIDAGYRLVARNRTKIQP